MSSSRTRRYRAAVARSESRSRGAASIEYALLAAGVAAILGFTVQDDVSRIVQECFKSFTDAFSAAQAQSSTTDTGVPPGQANGSPAGQSLPTDVPVVSDSPTPSDSPTASPSPSDSASSSSSTTAPTGTG